MEVTGLKNTLALIAAAGAMLCLVLAPREAIESARYALRLCAELILPSLLPFFTASALLIRLGFPHRLSRLLAPLARRLWGVSGAGATAFFAGICGGYPLGAQTVGELYASGQVSKEEAERLLGFCNNSGPSFLVGVIGASLLGSRAAGLWLYAIHVLAAALTGLVFRARDGGDSAPLAAEELSLPEALVGAVRQALEAVLNVSGFVVCFCVLSGMLDMLGVYSALASLISRVTGLDAPLLRAFLVGLLELSSGVGALRTLPAGPAVFVLSAFLCGWGGLSVQFQTLAVLAQTDLRVRRLLPGRLLCASFSALLAFSVGRLWLL